MAGIYLHIPFCQKKCLYCDFYSVVGGRQMAGFTQAIQREAKQRAHELEGQQVDTIYFGGGTPSLLFHQQVAEILDTIRDNYTIASNPEVTMECNPGDVSQVDIADLVACGVNRFSIGAQSFQNELLQTLGRRHSAEETHELFGYMRKEGVNNISLDLIYSIPGSNFEQLQKDLDTLLLLAPEHVSAYDLIYEPTTPFYKMRKEGTLSELPEELSVEMAHLVREQLKQGGYQHYEISNFALPSYTSRHNSSYWQGIPYIGLGPSAHSYLPPWRSSNEASIERYNGQLLNGAGFLDRNYEYISPLLAAEEYLLTRLRTKEGISLGEMWANGWALPSDAIAEMVHQGMLQQQGERIALTDKGLDFADRVIIALASDV